MFPLGTFVVNIIGCLAFGALAGAASSRLSLAPEVRLFWFTGILGGFTTFSSYAFESFALVGVLGGFTTFSSYAYESFALTQDGQFAAAALNIVGQVVAGFIGLWAGYVITN